MARLLFFRDFLGNRNENLNSEQAHTVLVIAGKVLKQGYHLVNDNWRVHCFDKTGKIVCRLPSYHRRLIVYQSSKILSKALL